VPAIGTDTPQGKTADQKMVDQHNKYRLDKEAIRANIRVSWMTIIIKPVCNPIEMPEAWE
jgi:hypothetical protein